MLRITIHRADDDVVMKLEGCLSGAWVAEMEKCWRQAMQTEQRGLQVDLRSICHVDDAGRELMTRMSLDGVRFLASGCVIPEMLREISESTGGRRN